MMDFIEKMKAAVAAQTTGLKDTIEIRYYLNPQTAAADRLFVSDSTKIQGMEFEAWSEMLGVRFCHGNKIVARVEENASLTQEFYSNFSLSFTDTYSDKLKEYFNALKADKALIGVIMLSCAYESYVPYLASLWLFEKEEFNIDQLSEANPVSREEIVLGDSKIPDDD